MKEHLHKDIAINESISQLIISHLNSDSYRNQNKRVEKIYEAMHIMLNGHYVKYDFNLESSKLVSNGNFNTSEFQKSLSCINEKQSFRKEKGVYYTPVDIARYIICNTFINSEFPQNKKLYNESESIEKLVKSNSIKEFLFNKTIFDPTCGAGEFLINAFNLKCKIAKRKNIKIKDNDYILILNSIFGNDINLESIEITRIRMFFECIKNIKDESKFIDIVDILKRNFTIENYIKREKSKCEFYNIIIGNPPYIEYNKISYSTGNNYGNIYADVLKNSIDNLNSEGVFGFVIPLSYVSTLRMSKIRSYIETNTKKQIILNFADRPDCLFTGVHQKLCVLFVNKGNSDCKIYTSKYNFWYQAEREKLLNECRIKRNYYTNENFIPKIGNSIEENIFKKIYTCKNNNILKYCNEKKGNLVYLNMRACFWIKAFSFNPGSKEYKVLSFSEEKNNYIMCILNSSLFWLFWTIISDCWHITNKELKYFFINCNNIDYNKFNILANELENELENTKKYIGSVQTNYEYKHKDCKNTIDKIDNELAKIYKLTNEELAYVKTYAIKYRTGKGA